MIKNASDILDKFESITKLRTHERNLGLSEFQRGQLSGAQQALAWAIANALDPILAFLTDEQLKEAINANPN